LPEFMEVEANEWDPHRLNKASYLLVSLSFVVRSNLAGESPSLSMHPLAHAWAKDRQELVQQGQTWIAAACVIALSIDSYGTPRENLVHLQSLLNIEVKTAFSLGPKPMLVSIFIIFGNNLEMNREDARLNSLLQDIFGILAIGFDKPSVEYLELYKIYRRNLANFDDMANFIQLQIQIMKIENETLPSSHYMHMISRHELARAYHGNGEVKRAIELQEQVVEAQEDLPTTNSRRLASQHELARYYYANGQVDRAIELIEYVVKIKEEVLPAIHSERLKSQHELALYYYTSGQLDRAIELMEYVVKIKEEVLPAIHPERLLSQHELARYYYDNGQVDRAIELMEYVLKIKEEVLPAIHPERLVSQHELARYYYTNGQVNRAIELMGHVVKIKEGVLPATDPERLKSEHVLAHFKKGV
jgi:tetratricopeptide (TPR) repeat protein